MFGTLYDQYNTLHIPIQEPIAFHHDVLEACSVAVTADDFHALLKERREQRIEELRQCWDSVSIRIAANPSLLDSDGDELSAADRWAAFLHFSREISLDALARYFSLFSHKESLPPLSSPPDSPDSKSTHSQPSSHSTASKPSTKPTRKRKRTSPEHASKSSCTKEHEKGSRPIKKIRALATRSSGDPAIEPTPFDGKALTEDGNSLSSPSVQPERPPPHARVRRSSRISSRIQVSYPGPPSGRVSNKANGPPIQPTVVRVGDNSTGVTVSAARPNTSCPSSLPAETSSKKRRSARLARRAQAFRPDSPLGQVPNRSTECQKSQICNTYT